MRRAVWAFLLSVPLVAVLAVGFGHDPNAIHSPLIGHAAPAFTLSGVDGKAFSLRAFRGKPVVVNFWASWCQDCLIEHPTLLSAWEAYAPRGVVFVGIDYQDHLSDAVKWLRTQGTPWRNLKDPGQRTALSFGVYGVPETFLIDRSGTIRYKFVGPVPAEQISRDLTALLRRRT